MNRTSDISGNAGGGLSLCTTVDSAYRLNDPAGGQIIPYYIFLNGTQRFVYSLQYDGIGPSVGNPLYVSGAPEQVLPFNTERQRRMAAWIFANAYPNLGADEMFRCLGVDPTLLPVLTETDAYAAVQTAVWLALEQIPASFAEFVDCETGLPHPKSPRLRAAVFALVSRAEEYAVACLGNGGSCGKFPEPECNACKDDALTCRNESKIPCDPAVPFVAFADCPRKVIRKCDWLMLGPFKVISNYPGNLCVTAEPFCDDPSFDTTPVDRRGEPLACVRPFQEFWLAVTSERKHECFYLTVTVAGYVTPVLFFEPVETG